MTTLPERFRGCMLGLAVGDATGAPYEGLPGDLIYSMGPAISIVETPSEKTRYYTDDTQMAIGVAETLLECGGIREESLCAAFVRNYDPARGYGQGARRVIEAMTVAKTGAAWPVRSSPAARWETERPCEWHRSGFCFAMTWTRLRPKQSCRQVPHTSIRLPSMARGYLRLRSPLLLAISRLCANFFGELRKRAKTEEFQWQLDIAAQLHPSDTVSGFGNSLEAHRSVVTSLCCFAASPDCYAEVIGRAIGQGNDTDTLAAMAGG